MFFTYIKGMDKILLLLSLPGFGNKKTRDFISNNPLIWDDDDYFSYVIKNIINEPLSPYIDRVKEIREKCITHDVSISECKMPRGLNSPLLIYTKGNNKLLESTKRVGVIGCRIPNKNSLEMAKANIYKAINLGWVIVSGFAKGCDMFAHKTTVKSNGHTIAVLPCGYKSVDTEWLLESGGLVISEYPPLSPVRKYKCVNRNRIIAGYSKGIYVVESGLGGGSQITVNNARKIGLPVINKTELISNDNKFDLFLKKCLK